MDIGEEFYILVIFTSSVNRTGTGKLQAVNKQSPVNIKRYVKNLQSLQEEGLHSVPAYRSRDGSRYIAPAPFLHFICTAARWTTLILNDPIPHTEY